MHPDVARGFRKRASAMPLRFSAARGRRATPSAVDGIVRQQRERLLPVADRRGDLAAVRVRAGREIEHLRMRSRDRESVRKERRPVAPHPDLPRRERQPSASSTAAASGRAPLSGRYGPEPICRPDQRDEKPDLREIRKAIRARLAAHLHEADRRHQHAEKNQPPDDEPRLRAPHPPRDEGAATISNASAASAGHHCAAIGCG